MNRMQDWEAFSYDRMIRSCISPFHLEIATWLTGERPIDVREVDTRFAAAEERVADKLLYPSSSCPSRTPG